MIELVRWFRRAGPLVALLTLVSCAPAPLPAPEAVPPLPARPLSPEAAASPTPGLPQDRILALPPAFRYEVTVRPAGAPDEPATVIAGQYREGAWQQTIVREGETSEELIVAPDEKTGALHTYTRAGTEAWTRWPGAGFDSGYGLASPFAVLRLYPLADQTARDTGAQVEAPEPASKVQAVFAAATVARLMEASVAAAARDAETRLVLATQLSALLAPQTITYWVADSGRSDFGRSGSGRIYQAAATLLTVLEGEEPSPWLEVVWRFSSYDDPAIAVTAPADFSDVAELAAESSEALAGARTSELYATTTLRVRVFESQGVLAQDATVTVYPAGKQQAAGEVASADAQFALAAGTYDVLVRAANAERSLPAVVVLPEALASRDVLFEFGTLELTVQHNGATPPVDIVVYPAGQREVWAAYTTDNPATLRVPSGLYDIEVGLPDLSGVKEVNGVEVLPGQTVRQTIDLVDQR